MTRVAVFLDYQNVYQGARESFGWKDDHFTYGQVYPRQLGLVVVDRGRPVDSARTLTSVTAFRGEPSAKHSRGGQAACQRQVDYWNAQKLVDGVTRPLKYYFRGTDQFGNAQYEPREKGIDVLIAIAMVMGARNNEFDVAVLMSGDSDLAPAVEAVQDLGKRCEVASWSSRDYKRGRLTVTGRSVWCHWLDERTYRLVCDPTDYTKAQPGGTGAVSQLLSSPGP